MKSHIITSTLQRDSDSNWHYIHVDKAIRDKLKQYEKRGSIPVTATIGVTTWNGSLMPWADGSAQLTVNAAVRKKEQLAEGSVVSAVIVVRK